MALTRRGSAQCLAAAVLFGLAAPAASVLADGLPTLVLAGLLYLGAALAVAPVALTDRRRLRPPRSTMVPLAVAVVAGGGVGPALLVAGLARTDAATASLLLNLELVATLVLAALFFGEHLGARVVAGGALVTVAAVVLAWEPGATVDVGAVLIAGACVCWGLDNCVTASLDAISPERVVLAKGVVAGSVNLTLGLVVATSPQAIEPVDVAAALVVGAFGYGASITLWVKGARQLGAARGQVVFATAPFIGALGAWLFLGDSVTVGQVVASAAAGLGVALTLRSAHDHLHEHQPLEHEHEHEHDDHHAHEHPSAEVGRHTHVHRHEALVHTHPHVPDLHHRHSHRPRRQGRPAAGPGRHVRRLLRRAPAPGPPGGG